MNSIVIGFVFANLVALTFLIYSIINYYNQSKDRRTSRKFHDYSTFTLVFAIVLFLIILYSSYRVYDLNNSIKKTGEFLKVALSKTASDIIKSRKN
jgi:heme/copper-type cytochrome/quinol oxidase subunit 2